MGFSSQGQGSGSTFFFELPLHSSAAAGIEPNNLDQVQPLPNIASTNNFFNSSRYSPCNRLKLMTPPSTSHSETTPNTAIIQSSVMSKLVTIAESVYDIESGYAPSTGVSIHKCDSSHVVDFDEEDARIEEEPEASYDAINEPWLVRVSTKPQVTTNEVERDKALGINRMVSYLIAINNSLQGATGVPRYTLTPCTPHPPSRQMSPPPSL